ncbi:MAG: phenylacetate--CoA ligase family protein [Candidatus Eiseniibacteriota bacterium]
MGVATEARRALEALPPGVRETLETFGAFLPRPFLYGRTFRATRAFLARSEREPASVLVAAQDARVRELVRYAYERVPYYRRVFDERGIRPEHIRGVADLKLLPLLDRELLYRHEEELLADGVPARSRERVSTGGTTGTPLRLWIDRGRSAKEWAFMTFQWGRVGYQPGSKRAVLRGAALSGGRLHEWHPLLDELVLSTFALSSDTLPRYLVLLERHRPEFLHAYPSSAEALGRLLLGVPEGRRPRFRALLLGSENLYPAQRAFLERTFGCPVFAWYGHSEKCLLGGGCERSNDYHLFPEYGVLEVVDERGEPVPPGGTGTIVGTGFLNSVMPFLRYATDDRGTLAEGSCPCGRAYPRLTAIEGRFSAERLFGERGETFSFTAINTHSEVFDRVLRFRIRQERAGEAHVLVVPRDGFGESDRAAIAAEYGRRAAGSVRFSVDVVPDLPLTGRGKFKVIEQLIPEDVQSALLGGKGEVA